MEPNRASSTTCLVDGAADMTFESWLDAFIELADTVGDEGSPVCPQCGYRTLRLQYVGDLTTRIGFAALWCDNCRRGMTLSRVKAPNGVHMLPFDADEAVLAAAIPNFEEVDPGPYRGQAPG